jgi:hypothetical protein
MSLEMSYGVRFQTAEGVENFVRCMAKELTNRLVKAKILGFTHIQVDVMQRKPGATDEHSKHGAGHGPCVNHSRSQGFKETLKPQADKIFSHALTLLEELSRTSNIAPQDVRGLAIKVQGLKTFVNPSLISSNSVQTKLTAFAVAQKKPPAAAAPVQSKGNSSGPKRGLVNTVDDDDDDDEDEDEDEEEVSGRRGSKKRKTRAGSDDAIVFVHQPSSSSSSSSSSKSNAKKTAGGSDMRTHASRAIPGFENLTDKQLADLINESVVVLAESGRNKLKVAPAKSNDKGKAKAKAKAKAPSGVIDMTIDDDDKGPGLDLGNQVGGAGITAAEETEGGGEGAWWDPPRGSTTSFSKAVSTFLHNELSYVVHDPAPCFRTQLDKLGDSLLSGFEH